MRGIGLCSVLVLRKQADNKADPPPGDRLHPVPVPVPPVTEVAWLFRFAYAGAIRNGGRWQRQVLGLGGAANIFARLSP
jgi:hypothetical protein